MLFITIGVFLCTTLAACTPIIQSPDQLRRIYRKQICQILLRSIASSKGTNLKFIPLPMAANPVYVFFRMAAPVTSGPISGESVLWQLKKAQHLPS